MRCILEIRMRLLDEPCAIWDLFVNIVNIESFCLGYEMSFSSRRSVRSIVYPVGLVGGVVCGEDVEI